MNNKYGYRLVDILKRGRGRENPPPRSKDRSEKEIKADRGDEGQGEKFSLASFLFFNCSR